jgi:hypothetical protein
MLSFSRAGDAAAVRDHAFVRTTGSEAAAAARIGVQLGGRMRGELLRLLRPCFARVEPWLQAGKYVAAAMSDLPKRNGWTLAERAGDRTPDRMQRLLNRAVWDAADRHQESAAAWTRRSA